MKNFPSETQAQIAKYIDTLNADFGDENHVFQIEGGRKYVKISHVSWGQKSVHSFVDAAGKIWKAATWKAPALNFPRGSIFDENCGVKGEMFRFGAM